MKDDAVMLVMFRVKNFASFRDEVVLDMRATSYAQHPSHILIEKGCPKLLKTTAIYGANASGKSNLIRAMHFFKQKIFQRPAIDDGDSAESISNAPPYEPFLLSPDRKEPTEFQIVFFADGKTHDYGFSLVDDQVVEEVYYVGTQDVFTRRGDSLAFGKKAQPFLSKYDKISPRELFASAMLVFLDKEAKETLFSGFWRFFAREYVMYDTIFYESSIKRAHETFPAVSFINEEGAIHFRERCLPLIKLADFSIRDLEIRSQEFSLPGRKPITRYVLDIVHTVYDADKREVGTVIFPLERESSGTKQFLELIEDITDAIDRGGVFIADEMSAHLHPFLSKFIVDLFQAESNTRAQLIFTTHDVSMLSSAQFRRDEIVFVEKDEQGASEIFSLSDLKEREDVNFQKNYLQGKYGAIPIIREVMEEEAEAAP